jgi:hypothetical protein
MNNGRQSSAMRVWLGIAFIMVFVLASHAVASPVKGIHARMTQPVCPRGGILMVPLTADSPGDHWPQTLGLRLASGVTISGSIAWIETSTPRSDRHWTDDPRGLSIRALLRDDDSTRLEQFTATGPYLLARLPNDGEGALFLGRQKLEATWRDVPGLASLRFTDDAQPPRDRPIMDLAPAPDRPDPVSPFEYWRWTLLAEKMELNPPRPFGGDLERMAAEHYADLWRIGLDRLASQSPRIAEECRDILTRTCIDRRPRALGADETAWEHVPFATWIADPVQVSALLAHLLDFGRTDADVLTDVVAWLDEQARVFLWPDAEAVDFVRLTMVTPRTEPVVATFQWSGVSEPPTAVQIEPGVLMQVRVDRPPAPKAAAIGLPTPPEPPVRTLHIVAGGQQFDVTFGPRIVAAKPPGVFFRALSPPLTLAEVQARAQRTIAPQDETLVQIRRLGGRWEVFFECHRMMNGPDVPDHVSGGDTAMMRAGGGMAGAPQGADESLRSYDDLRGIEAVTLVLGPQPDGAEKAAPMIWLTIPENAIHRVIRGVNDGTLQVHKRSYSDRWYCRIVLPEAWFSAGRTNPAFVGCIRSHGDSAQLDTGPNACAPWKPLPSRAAINLEQWDDLPQQD